jgi:hypothetical protein
MAKPPRPWISACMKFFFADATRSCPGANRFMPAPKRPVSAQIFFLHAPKRFVRCATRSRRGEKRFTHAVRNFVRDENGFTYAAKRAMCADTSFMHAADRFCAASTQVVRAQERSLHRPTSVLHTAKRFTHAEEAPLHPGGRSEPPGLRVPLRPKGPEDARWSHEATRGSRCAVCAPVAQLDRAVAFEATCRGFESLRAY